MSALGGSVARSENRQHALLPPCYQTRTQSPSGYFGRIMSVGHANPLVKPVVVRSIRKCPEVGRTNCLVSGLFGWWGIPWGPVYTLQTIGKNSAGGYQ